MASLNNNSNNLLYGLIHQPTMRYLAGQDLPTVLGHHEGLTTAKETIALFRNDPSPEAANTVYNYMQGNLTISLRILHTKIAQAIAKAGDIDLVCPGEDLQKAYSNKTLTSSQINLIAKLADKHLPYVKPGDFDCWREPFNITKTLAVVEHHIPTSQKALAEVERLKKESTPRLQHIAAAIISKERKGFIGYHATNGAVWAFHTVIQQTVNTLLGLNVKDFFFVRTPVADKDYSTWTKEKIFAQNFNVCDEVDPYKKVLLSLNFVLFGNYNLFRANSMALFLSASPPRKTHVLLLKTELRAFFSQAGLKEELANTLFELAFSISKSQNMLVQFFEKQKADKATFAKTAEVAYPCSSGGKPISEDITTLLEHPETLRCSHQYRLLIGKVKPEDFEMRIYANIDPLLVHAVKRMMSKILQSVVIDTEKSKLFAMELRARWGLPITLKSKL